MEYTIHTLTNMNFERDDTDNRNRVKITCLRTCYKEDELSVPIMTFSLIPFKKNCLIRVQNKETGEITEFKSPVKFNQWKEEATVSKMYSYVISHSSCFKEGLTTKQVDTLNEYEKISDIPTKKASAKMFNVLVIDADTNDALIEDEFTDIDEMKEFLFANVDPNHPSFSPSGVCVNVNYRIFINNIDVTAYFDYEDNCELIFEGSEEKMKMEFIRDTDKSLF